MRKEIENWWIQARKDLQTAQNSFQSKDYYACVFWCQQAVEKALKALCLLRFREIPQGHSILYLSQKVNLPKELLSGIRELNPEYLTTRYPDMVEGVPADLYDEEIAEKHYSTAKKVLQWTERLIPK